MAGPKLLCQAQALPKPQFQWRFRPENNISATSIAHLQNKQQQTTFAAATPVASNGTTTNGAEQMVLQTGAQAHRQEVLDLSQTRVSRAQSGRYVCVAQNQFGWQQAEAHVNVLYKPSCRTYHLWTVDPTTNYSTTIVAHTLERPTSDKGASTTSYNDSDLTTSDDDYNSNDDHNDANDDDDDDNQISSNDIGGDVAAKRPTGNDGDVQQHRLSAKVLNKYKDYLRRYSMALEANQQPPPDTTTQRHQASSRDMVVKQFTFACVAYEANPVKNLQFHWRLNSNNSSQLSSSSSYLIPRQVVSLTQTAGGILIWPSNSGLSSAISLRLINRLDLDQLSMITLELRYNVSSTPSPLQTEALNSDTNKDEASMQDDWVDQQQQTTNNNKKVRSTPGSSKQQASWRQQFEDLLTCSVANEIGVSQAAPVRLRSRPLRRVQTPNSANLWRMPQLSKHSLLILSAIISMMVLIVVIVSLLAGVYSRLVLNTNSDGGGVGGGAAKNKLKQHQHQNNNISNNNGSSYQSDDDDDDDDDTTTHGTTTTNSIMVINNNNNNNNETIKRGANLHNQQLNKQNNKYRVNQQHDICANRGATNSSSDNQSDDSTSYIAALTAQSMRQQQYQLHPTVASNCLDNADKLLANSLLAKTVMQSSQVILSQRQQRSQQLLNHSATAAFSQQHQHHHQLNKHSQLNMATSRHSEQASSSSPSSSVLSSGLPSCSVFATGSSADGIGYKEEDEEEHQQQQQPKQQQQTLSIKSLSKLRSGKVSDFSLFANRVLDKNREFLQSMRRGPIRAVAASRSENEAGSASSCLKLNSPSSQSQSTSPGSSSFMPNNNTTTTTAAASTTTTSNNNNSNSNGNSSINKNGFSPLDHDLLTTIYQRDQEQHHHYNQLRPTVLSNGGAKNNDTMSPPTYSNLMLFNQQQQHQQQNNNNYLDGGNIQFRRTHSARPYPKPVRYIDANGREQIDYMGTKYMVQQQDNNNNSIFGGGTTRTLTTPRFYSNNNMPRSMDMYQANNANASQQSNSSLMHFDQQQRQQRLDLILAQQNSLINSNTIHPSDLSNHGSQQSAMLPSPYPAHRQSLKQQYQQQQHRHYFYTTSNPMKTKVDNNDNDDQLVEHIYDQNAYASPEITPIRVITTTNHHQQNSPSFMLRRNVNGNIDQRNIADTINHNRTLKDQASVSQLIARFNYSNLV